MSRRASPFEKWEGLGNDFILVEGLPLNAERVRRLCDRRLGIGGDGVLLLDRSPARMEVWNADGSRPEMCGNGLRCAAAWLVAQGLAVPPEGLRVATDAGEKRCEVVVVEPDLYEVTVDMGCARLTEPLSVRLDDREHHFTSVDMGNPHAVTFESHPEDAIDTIAPRISMAPPAGVNVELCRMIGPRRIEVLVWERGVGRTLACGTGACAVAAAACEAGLTPYEAPIEVVLPGGALTITVASGTRAITMRGPARRVFTGQVVST
ncbi:diaminopimelate epimerase [Chondromyces crocatus]|uniref:Diaminopimelate epimerase n=1 Tax=Chondromyces crocatus TaxID=52 RepID=A0A0K1E6T8_CHOCO|nr:diaminopimelate epimerase [Chondromyces crocatus]AKT36417.1 uncharacterized protein CMC5_005300 [Chondromyces crocatus]